MDKRANKRQSKTIMEMFNKSKKVKLEAVEETENLATSAHATEEAVAATPKEDSISDLREQINLWIQKQEQYEEADLNDLEEASNHGDDPEDDVDLDAIEVPLRIRLANYSDQTIRKSYKYECEWRKCKFMSGNDRKYFLHVESHAELALETQRERYTCEWDLCDYTTEDDYTFAGHVHFHAYHTKLKVYGASMHMLLKLSNCNLDSRMRNTISNRSVTFRCEWAECTERFNKALHFFHHVKSHIDDQLPHGKKATHKEIVCQWSLCEAGRFNHRMPLVKHMQMHTQERDIACFNCGTTFRCRNKYVDHCYRQIEIAHRKYQCELCGRYYATKVLLHNHVESHDKAYQCELCPVRFSSKGQMSQHLRAKHLGHRNFKCPQCDHATFFKKDLITHILTHEGKLYRCEEFGCNVVYRSLGSMKRHISWHYNLPPPTYACHLCEEKSYSMGYLLTKHLRFKHGVTRAPGYSRLRYKIDTDGMFRLSTFVEEKLKQQIEERKAAEQQKSGELDEAGTANEGSEPAGSEEKKKRKSTAKAVAAKGGDTVQKDSTLSKTLDVPSTSTKAQKLKINAIESVGVHEFRIELGIEAAEPAAETLSPSKGAAVGKGLPKKNGTESTAGVERPLVRVKQATKESVNFGPEPAKQPKDVKDFMVMKRYLKSSEKLVEA
uniref:C2H2-type domain-containing protein n=1 Tax=Anopheles christyi TaxID=43041 RepID=A0A2C9GT08_9DIPT